MAEKTDLARYEPVGERTAEEIRHDIETKRENISETVDLLGDRIQESLDWRVYVGKHPFVAVGVASGLGLLVSKLFVRHPTPRERMLDAIADSIEDTSGRMRDYLGEVFERDHRIGTAVRGAVAGLVSRLAIDFLKGKLNQRMGRTDSASSRERHQDSRPVSAASGLSPNVHATRSSSVG